MPKSSNLQIFTRMSVNGGAMYLRYNVDVMWFRFLGLQLLPIRFTQQKFVVHEKIYDETCKKIGLQIGPPLI